MLKLNWQKGKSKMSYIYYIIDALKNYIDKSILVVDFEKFSFAELEKIRKICCNNRVLPILANVLNENGQNNKLIADGIKARTANELSFAIRLKEYRNLINRLENVDFALVKGIHVGHKAYINPFDRTTSDLDLLVKYEHVSITERILLDAGFRQAYVTSSGLKDYDRMSKLFYAMNTHSLAPYRKISNNILYEIDINFYAHFKDDKIISSNDFLISKTNCNLNGIEVPVLDDTYAFLYLVLHHYRECVSLYHVFCNQDFDLLKACDIYYLYRRTDIDIHKLFKLVNQYNLYEELSKIVDDVSSVFNDDCFKDLEIQFIATKQNCNYINWPIKLPERLEIDNRYDLIKDKLNECEKKNLSKNVSFLK